MGGENEGNNLKAAVEAGSAELSAEGGGYDQQSKACDHEEKDGRRSRGDTYFDPSSLE